MRSLRFSWPVKRWSGLGRDRISVAVVGVERAMRLRLREVEDQRVNVRGGLWNCLTGRLWKKAERYGMVSPIAGRLIESAGLILGRIQDCMKFISALISGGAAT